MKSARTLIKKKSPLQKKVKEKSFPIIAIGASAGGLEAISLLLKNLPADTGMAFIYVQHLSPDHKSFLTSILSKITKMKVQEIENMEHILPNNVYVIPHNKEIKVIDGHIQLIPRLKNISGNLSIDLLFSSLAQTHGKNVVGIILSGYASDGMIGLKAIKKAGGVTFAQDDSAQASSMPRSAIASGVVDFILSPKEIAIELVRLSKNGLKKSGKLAGAKDVKTGNNNNLNSIFTILLKEKGVDFSHYKMPTIKRRLNHKMAESGVKTVKQYIKLLLGNKSEVDALFKNFLIHVTGFFRDKEAFRYLKTILLPKLLMNKNSDETLRIWVAACSTGEEAYSIAMLIAELQENKTKKLAVQIFATDLNEQTIQIARAGEYSLNDIKPLAQKYKDRYFKKFGNKYLIAKELREMCVFAPHNILLDPPFSQMDFISCRNLLIYFDTSAQKKVFNTLHFGIVEGGYLMLGKAETIGASSQLFAPVNSKLKIYYRKKNTSAIKILELTPRFPRINSSGKKITAFSKNTSTSPSGIENAIDTALLSNHMPACVVVNKEMDILQFRGPIALFLTHPPGKASLNILKMTRPEFAFDLRNAIHKSIKTGKSVHKSDIEIKIESVIRMLTFEVSPLKIEWEEPLLLVVFTMKEQVETYIENTKGKKNNSILKDRRILKLEEELISSRAEMNSIIETQETTYEELQAANEEIVSTNEEFQTLNEELETSKEEIEATNEELISTNQELQIRHDLLIESNDYAEAIIAAVHEPLLVLHRNFQVKSANKSFYQKFLVKKEETEGKLLFELGNKQWNIQKLHDVLNNIIFKNGGFENFEVTHTFPGIGEKVMLLNAHLIIQKANNEPLILLAIEDITERSRYYLKEKYSLSLIEASLDPLVTISIQGKITDTNEATVNITGIERAKLIGSDFFDYFTEPQKAREVYQEVFAKGSVANSPLTLRHKAGKLTDVLFNGSVYKDDNGKVMGVVIVARDVTDQKRNATELTEAKVFAELATEIAEEAKIKAESATRIAEDAVKAKQQFLSNMSHEIRTPMNAIIGFTKVVLKTELTVKQKEYLTAIKVSGDALIVLINDILDLAKVDAGKMTFEKTPFKLAYSISAMLHLFETKIQEKNLKLVTQYDSSIPEVLVGDPVRLHQIILNLVSNAVKFTTKGKITVSVKMLSEDEEHATIEFAVTDTGIGIPENKIKNIFDDFQQATSDTSRLYGGTGLGLAIVKQLVEPQGGTINVVSKINEGSTFSFTLTFQKTAAEAIQEIETEEPNLKNKNIKVLVVEDIALNQLLMKTLLDDFGFERDIAGNGKIAIEKLKNKAYDIILMDLQMPEMNGFEATDYIRNTMNSKIPIIALTADVTTVDLAKCKAVGMNDYIAKPVDERLLYNKIVGLVNKPVQLKNHPSIIMEMAEIKKSKCINLDYLNKRTKSNKKLMMEMITAYLNQTPPLINLLKQSWNDRDWVSLQATAHKIIPSFAIMGIHSDFENMAKTVQEFAHNQQKEDGINELVNQLENICNQACLELTEEFNNLKNTN